MGHGNDFYQLDKGLTDSGKLLDLFSKKHDGTLSLGMQRGDWAGRQGRGDLVIVWSKGGALGAGGCLEA